MSVDTSTLADPRDFEVTLPANPGSVSHARQLVEKRCLELQVTIDDITLGDIELIVTELVANAVRYGAPEIKFRFRVEPSAVEIAVLDHGPGTPQVSADGSPMEATSGRGLLMVDRLARSWGVEPLPRGMTGKVVWARVALT